MLYYATKKEMARLDKIAVKNGLQIEQMMELAAAHIIGLFEKLRVRRSAKVAVVCGRGNKGGDGLAAARHLINHGWPVDVVLILRDIKADPRRQLRLLRRMKARIAFYKNKKMALAALNSSDVIIDAMIGYNLDGPPRKPFDELIEAINASKKMVISYDLPSGVDASTGECFNPCVKADATLSLALPKRAFRTKEGRKMSGRIFLADIGIPDFIYRQLNRNYSSPFLRKGSLIEL